MEGSSGRDGPAESARQYGSYRHRGSRPSWSCQLCKWTSRAVPRSAPGFNEAPGAASCSRKGAAPRTRCEPWEVRTDSAVAKQSCSRRHHPMCFCSAFGAHSSGGQPSASSALAEAFCPWPSVAPGNCQSICFIYIYTHTYVGFCVYAVC